MSERIELDAHDKRLAAIYSEDGLVSVAQAAQLLGVTAPTVRSRLRGLLSRGALRVAGLVDPFKVRGLTLAMVCLTLQSHEELDIKLEKISGLENVTWAAVVTGRYDIVVEVALSDEVADLYRFLHEDLSKVGGVSASESFIVMKARRKWTLLPRGVRKRFLAP